MKQAARRRCSLVLCAYLRSSSKASSTSRFTTSAVRLPPFSTRLPITCTTPPSALQACTRRGQKQVAWRMCERHLGSLLEDANV